MLACVPARAFGVRGAAGSKRRQSVTKPTSTAVAAPTARAGVTRAGRHHVRSGGQDRYPELLFHGGAGRGGWGTNADKGRVSYPARGAARLGNGPTSCPLVPGSGRPPARRQLSVWSASVVWSASAKRSALLDARTWGKPETRSFPLISTGTIPERFTKIAGRREGAATAVRERRWPRVDGRKSMAASRWRGRASTAGWAPTSGWAPMFCVDAGEGMGAGIRIHESPRPNDAGFGGWRYLLSWRRTRAGRRRARPAR
jgi:hypothetical protein